MVKNKGLRYILTALLHELIEYGVSNKDEILIFSGEEVCKAVEILTLKKGAAYGTYVDNILKNPIAKAVKVADKIDDLRDLEFVPDKQFVNDYLDKTLKYYVGKFNSELDTAYEKCIKRIYTD